MMDGSTELAERVPLSCPAGEAMRCFALLLRGERAELPAQLGALLSENGSWVRLPALRRRIRSWYDGSYRADREHATAAAPGGGGGALRADAWELVIARHGLYTPEEHHGGGSLWQPAARSLLSLPVSRRDLHMTAPERELAASLTVDAAAGEGGWQPIEPYAYFSNPLPASDVFPREGLPVAPSDLHSVLHDMARTAAASPPCERFLDNLDACRLRHRADPTFGRFLSEVQRTLQEAGSGDGATATAGAVRRVFYRALKEAAYRRAGEYIMVWHPQWLARLGIIRVGADPEAVDLSRASSGPRRAARHEFLDEGLVAEMLVDVPVAYHWTTLEEIWIEPAKPPLVQEATRLARGALPLPRRLTEADRKMVGAALELALTDVSPVLPHPPSPLLGEPSEQAAVDRFFASAAEYWFDEVLQAGLPSSMGLWTPSPATGAAPSQPAAAGEEQAAEPPPQVLEGAVLDAVLDALEEGSYQNAPAWLLDPETNHEVVLALGKYPNVPPRRRRTPALPAGASAASVQRFIAAAGLPDLGTPDRDPKARQLKLTENYIRLALKAIVEEPGRRLSDDELRGMFHGLNIALFGLVSTGYAGFPELLLPLLSHLAARGHHGPFVALVARTLSIGYSKHEDFAQAERAAHAAFAIHKAAAADWERRRSQDGDEYVNLLEASQQANLATSGLYLRIYEQEVISYRYLQERRGRSPKDPLLTSQLHELLKRARDHAAFAKQLISEAIGQAAHGVPADKIWSRGSTLAWHTNARVMLIRSYLHLAHLLAMDGRQDAKVEEHLELACDVTRELTTYRLFQEHVNELVRFALQYAFLSGMRILPVSEPGLTAEARAGAQLPDFFYRPSESWRMFDADAAGAYLARHSADAGILVSVTHPRLRAALTRRSHPRDPSIWNDDVDPYRCWFENNQNLARRRDIRREIAQLLSQPDYRLPALLPLYLRLSQAPGAGR